MPITPTIPIPGIVIDKLTYPVKKLLGFTAKNSMQAQGKSEKEIIQDLIKRDDPSFYSGQTRDGGNEIDTYLYGIPYNTENTSNVGPSYENYLSKNFPLRKHAVKTYDTHFGDTLYIDQKYKDQVLDELEQGKTVGASMGRYAHAPSYIINTKDDERRPYDAGGHLMQFQYDKDGNVIANMSDIYDFLPKDFEEKYGAVKEYGPLKTAGMYAMHYAGTPFIVRQNGIPVRFKEIVPEYKTELQSQLGNFLSNWGDMYDLTIPHRLTDEQIEEIFDGKQSGDEILDFMDQKGYLAPVFKKGGSIHIKKKNRGKFTDYCGGKVTEECIAKGKKSKDPKIRKRATFAANARKWKHENGGILKYQSPAEPLPQVIKTAATFPDWLRGTWSYLSGNKDSKLLESQYRPTKETNPNIKYYYRDGLNTDVIKNILGGTDYGKKNRFGENLYYKDFNDVWNRLSAAGGRAERNTDNSQLGAYTIGIGEDNKGRYISYYDKFDWAPAGLPEIFHPYEIYNRIYEDEFNNTQSNLKNITYSGYNPSGNWFFKSGSKQYNNVK